MSTIINSSVKSLRDIMMASPDPSELPLPPQKWLAKDPSMVLLDAATTEALEHYWVGQVKASQYAIFRNS
jgi:hypothetical protein